MCVCIYIYIYIVFGRITQAWSPLWKDTHFGRVYTVYVCYFYLCMSLDSSVYKAVLTDFCADWYNYFTLVSCLCSPINAVWAMGLHVQPSIAPILHITAPGPMSHFAETWVSLQTTTYKSKGTKYFNILLLLTCEEVLHATTLQLWAQNSTVLPPTMNFPFRGKFIAPKQPSNSLPFLHYELVTENFFQKWW